MAQLSDADKRVLLGPDYLEKERRAEAEKAARGGRLTPDEQRARLGRWRATAAVVAFVAALLAISHVAKASTYDPKLAFIGAIVAVLALAVAATLHMSMQRVERARA